MNSSYFSLILFQTCGPISQYASNLINQFLEFINKHQIIPCDIEHLIKKIHLFSEKRILTTTEMNWGELQADYETSLSVMLEGDAMDREKRDGRSMVYTDWRTPDNFSSPGAFFKATPPISLCLEEKKTELEAKRNKWTDDKEHIIPIGLRAPYSK
jgi:hypothetical protein